MNRIILTIITLALIINLAKANDIDNLKTKDDVQKFLVEKVDTAWSKHNFFETIDKNDTTIFGKGHFLKIDLDNNGLSDLLINGTYLFAITDNGNGRYSKHFIDRGAFMLENHKLKGIIYKNKTPLIVIDKRKNNITIIEDDKQKEDSILKVMNARVDTLIFTFGDFCEYNPVPDNFKIEEIRISTSGCYGKCPIFEMKIDAKKNATYIAKEYNDEKGKFTGRIDDISFDRIIKTINYIKLTTLSDEYFVNWSDDQGVTLEIKYNNGQKKKIIDYGGIGSFGLEHLYKQLFALRKTQKWK